MLPEQIPALIASRYRVVRPIGEGNMGKVYLVEHVHTGEHFALKVLLSHVGANAKLVKRFKREAWLPARIKSEHVVRVIDADVAVELGGAPFLVMELLDGCDLELYLDRQGKLAPAEVVGIFTQIAKALDRAHEMGIVHRDLKPENIFLHKRPDGFVMVKVLDFGISKMMGEGLGGIEDAGLTRTGVVLGTPLYMPPEQATGDSSRIGPASDMWALGLIAFRLLTGKLYWKSETVAELLVEILSTPMPPPSKLDDSIPASFDEWFARSCNRSVQARWTTVGEQVAALGKAFELTVEHVRPQVLIRAMPADDEAVETPRPPTIPPATIPSGGTTRADTQRTQTRPSSRRFRKHATEPTVIVSSPAMPLATQVQADPLAAHTAKTTGGTGARTAAQTGATGKSPDAERRQLTIVSCDLVPQNELAARLDPKELREAQRAYQDAFTDAVRRANGYLAEIRTDGLSIYFGYPVAHEDDARQAVATAMDLVEIGTKLSSQRERIQLDVRIGVHTGLVLAWEIREGEGRPMAIAGATPAMATRLKDLAQRNTVLISGSTHRLVRGYFACLNLGMRTVRGATQPIETFQVSYESGARSRLEGITSRGLTPLIGRDLEIGLLMDRWARVEDSAGQVVFVSGEAGIGKSRLARVFKERLEATAHMWVESRCLPHQRDRMLFPMASVFQTMFRLDGENPGENVDKLQRALEHFSFSPLEVIPALASLLALPLEPPYPKALPAPEEEQQRVSEVLLGVLNKMAKRQPVVLMLSDLHWADAATVALISRLIQEIPTSAIFLLLTARPSFVPPWATRTHVTSLPLSRLTAKRIKTMAEEVANGKSLPAEVIDQLVAKTDGIPLFIEELTKTILESGLLVEKGYEYELTGPLPPLVIPSTLRDALMARLDVLGAAKRVAQVAAILGKEFSYDVLEAVSALDPMILQGALERLVDADLLYVRGRPPRAKYTFKHVLMQDTAYESMLQSKRQGYHRNVAQILTEQFADLVQSQPEMAARHYTFGGLHDQAVPYWQRAAQRRLDLAVCEEATGHLMREITQLQSSPDEPERDRQEMALLASLCPLLRAAKGVNVPEVERAYARARELSGKLKDSPDILPMLLDVWQFYQAREDLSIAHQLGTQILELAKPTALRMTLLQAHSVLGATCLHMGKLASTRLHLEQAMSVDERDRRHAVLSTTGHDEGVSCLINAAWTLWLMGYPEQAIQHIERAHSLAKAVMHAESLYFVSISAGLLQGCLGRGAVQPHADVVASISVEHSAPFWAAAATLVQGAAQIEGGKVDDGISTMTRALHTQRSLGVRLWLGTFAVFVAEACLKSGQAERGMSLITEPLDNLSRPDSDKLCESELHRLHGEFMLLRSVSTGGIIKVDRAEIEQRFRRALEIAREQEACLLALRAAISLGRLLGDQNRKDEAQEVVRGVFQSFTEGLDMPDMRDAALLLDSLQAK